MAVEINPSTLFLDIGNVLLTNGWDRDMRQLAAKTFDLDPEEMDERHHLTYDTYEEGKLSLDSYLDRVIFHRPRHFSKDQFKEFIFGQTQTFPQMIELIRALKVQHGLKIAAVSNEGLELMQYRIQHFELDSFIDFFIGSSFVHIRKPDLDIYRLALNVAQVDPRRVIYIDDREMFVQVAESLGIHGIVHKNYTSTKAKLTQMGLGLESDQRSAPGRAAMQSGGF